MVTELPLFITNLNENPLSIEEIQDAFVNLIKFADHTEKEIFEKDLQKEELNLPVNNPHTNNNANFRKSKKQVIADHWIEEDGFFILEEEVEVENKKYSDIERQALIDNHNNFYVKTFKRNGKWLYQVSMITKDAHKVELQLLEKHFKVVINKMVW
jgi:hypothetical protein